jgi:hypothetical protein
MKTYERVRLGKYLSDSFSIQNGLKQGDALSPLHFNFALEYAIRKVQDNQAGLKLKGTRQLLASADDVNLLGDNMDTINKNTETLVYASKEVGLEVKVDKTKYMLVSRDQNAGQNREVKIGNGSFENASQFKYLNDSNKSKFYLGGNGFHKMLGIYRVAAQLASRVVLSSTELSDINTFLLRIYLNTF